jgi:hypothetical protein
MLSSVLGKLQQQQQQQKSTEIFTKAYVDGEKVTASQKDKEKVCNKVKFFLISK